MQQLGNDGGGSSSSKILSWIKPGPGGRTAAARKAGGGHAEAAAAGASHAALYAAGRLERTASLENSEGEFSRNRGSAQKGKIVDTTSCALCLLY